MRETRSMNPSNPEVDFWLDVQRELESRYKQPTDNARQGIDGYRQRLAKHDADSAWFITPSREQRSRTPLPEDDFAWTLPDRSLGCASRPAKSVRGARPGPDVKLPLGSKPHHCQHHRSILWRCQTGSGIRPRLLRDRPPIVHGFRSREPRSTWLAIVTPTLPLYHKDSTPLVQSRGALPSHTP